MCYIRSMNSEPGNINYPVGIQNFPKLRERGYVYVDKTDLLSAGLLSRDPIPSLFQTGYLTIKKYDSEFSTYLLDYPNEEVRNGFAKSLVPYFDTRAASPATKSRKYK